MTSIESIVKHIESLDFIVVERNEGETRVILAEPMVSIDEVVDPAKPKAPRRFRQMVRIDGNDDASRLRAARQLALQCGINLDGG